MCILSMSDWKFYITCAKSIQNARRKGIQNKIIISQKAFIIHIYELHHYKGKLSKFFSEYITSSINFNVDSLGGMTNIQTIFDLVPRCLKYVWCYHRHSIPYASFQMLKVVDLNLVDNAVCSHLLSLVSRLRILLP
jgi:hypothetical protein